MNKLLIALVLTAVATSSFAESVSKNFHVSATILPYCKLSSQVKNGKMTAVQECFGKVQYPVAIKEESIDGMKVTLITY